MSLNIRGEETHALVRRLADLPHETDRHCASLPVLNDRGEDDILGYDERGLPGRW